MAIGAIATGIDVGDPSSVVDGSTVRDVDQHPWPELASRPGGLVVGEGDLVPGAAGDVVVGGGVHRRPCQRLEVGEPDDPR